MGRRVGDWNGDGVDRELSGKSGSATVVSGEDFEPLAELRYPDAWDEHAVTRAVGDLDGVGHDDLALGGPNLDLGIVRPRSPEALARAPEELRSLALPEVLERPSEPISAFTRESGRALVYSGRTGEVLLGVRGEAGFVAGLGWEVASLPDVRGDGAPDLLVCSGERALVFAGPGPVEER